MGSMVTGRRPLNEQDIPLEPERRYALHRGRHKPELRSPSFLFALNNITLKSTYGNYAKPDFGCFKVILAKIF